MAEGHHKGTEEDPSCLRPSGHFVQHPVELWGPTRCLCEAHKQDMKAQAGHEGTSPSTVSSQQLKFSGILLLNMEVQYVLLFKIQYGPYYYGQLFKVQFSC